MFRGIRRQIFPHALVPSQPFSLRMARPIGSPKDWPATSRARSCSSSAASAPVKESFSAVQRVSDFEEKSLSRPEFDHSESPIEVTQSPDPTWSYGDGVRTGSAQGKAVNQSHRGIDPYAPERAVSQNYRLLISGIAPRPVGFVSTVSAKGETKNLAPFSYFQVVDHDPPMFVLGFSSRSGTEKDTFLNLKETGECVINTVSENMIEAVNASSIDAPYGLSEWDITGLTEAPTTTVKPSRVKESVFSIEAKVLDIKELEAHKPGMSGAAICLVKATRFWVREDAVNEDCSHIELDKLRPIAQMGGMSYGRISSTFELPRRRWQDEQPRSNLLRDLQPGKS